ncbi:energy transducer TonB [Tenacibaculum agarivorans]|uniref:energy transducer TonB n=1 Tax=Tenacibaculum agarivorans TaxID=1908389 RepID=UPI00094BC415|nr:energy transducer TonB [Tenacibaculum agarivorans]
MVKKITLLLIVLFITSNAFTQSDKTCDNPVDEPALDLNSITKCAIKDSNEKSAKKVTVEVTSRRRVVRKRDAATGVMTSDYSHKIASMKKKTDIINTLNVSKNNTAIVPFNYADEIPLFKKCESAPIYQQEKCFKSKLANHIRKNMKYPVEAYEKGIQGRVLVHFVISKEGKVENIKAISPYKGEILGKEAKRIIKKLPQFIPGKHGGSLTTIKYGLPITFKIPGVKRTNIRKVSKKVIVTDKTYEFSDLEVIPQFSTCKQAADKSLQCFNKNLVQHIQDNFAYPTAAIDSEIQGTVTIKFIINDKGKVANIEAKGPANGKILEDAAIKLIEKLPEFQPAQKSGRKVNAKYSFPVDFKLN